MAKSIRNAIGQYVTLDERDSRVQSLQWSDGVYLVTAKSGEDAKALTAEYTRRGLYVSEASLSSILVR